VARTKKIPKVAKPAQRAERPSTPPTEARPVAKHPGVSALGSKHRATLLMIFTMPTRSDIRWSNIEALIRALGGTVSAGSGSRRRIFLVRPAVFHEPHPDPMTDKGAVKHMRDYLRSVGVKP